MEQKTQHQKIVDYLQSVNGWVPGFLLSKRELLGQWVGSRGERSARDLVSPDCPKEQKNKVVRELGTDLMERGITVDAFGRIIEKKYVYYKYEPWVISTGTTVTTQTMLWEEKKEEN